MIKSEEVTKIFMNCILNEDEVVDGKPVVPVVEANGIMINVAFHEERLSLAKEQIFTIIEELPNEFKEGWTFLNLCMGKDGNQWTGMHQVCEQLVLLGIATKKMVYLFPKELWSALPGGVPYIQVIETEKIK